MKKTLIAAVVATSVAVAMLSQAVAGNGLGNAATITGTVTAAAIIGGRPKVVIDGVVYVGTQWNLVGARASDNDFSQLVGTNCTFAPIRRTIIAEPNNKGWPPSVAIANAGALTTVELDAGVAFCAKK